MFFIFKLELLSDVKYINVLVNFALATLTCLAPPFHYTLFMKPTAAQHFRMVAMLFTVPEI